MRGALKMFLFSFEIALAIFVLNLLGRAQPVIPPNLYVNEHKSLGSPGKSNRAP